MEESSSLETPETVHSETRTERHIGELPRIFCDAKVIRPVDPVAQEEGTVSIPQPNAPSVSSNTCR